MSIKLRSHHSGTGKAHIFNDTIYVVGEIERPEGYCSYISIQTYNMGDDSWSVITGIITLSNFSSCIYGDNLLIFGEPPCGCCYQQDFDDSDYEEFKCFTFECFNLGTKRMDGDLNFPQHIQFDWYKNVK